MSTSMGGSGDTTDNGSEGLSTSSTTAILTEPATQKTSVESTTIVATTTLESSSTSTFSSSSTSAVDSGSSESPSTIESTVTQSTTSSPVPTTRYVCSATRPCLEEACSQAFCLSGQCVYQVKPNNAVCFVGNLAGKCDGQSRVLCNNLGPYTTAASTTTSSSSTTTRTTRTTTAPATFPVFTGAPTEVCTNFMSCLPANQSCVQGICFQNTCLVGNALPDGTSCVMASGSAGVCVVGSCASQLPTTTLPSTTTTTTTPLTLTNCIGTAMETKCLSSPCFEGICKFGLCDDLGNTTARPNGATCRNEFGASGICNSGVCLISTTTTTTTTTAPAPTFSCSNKPTGAACVHNNTCSATAACQSGSCIPTAFVIDGTGCGSGLAGLCQRGVCIMPAPTDAACVGQPSLTACYAGECQISGMCFNNRCLKTGNAVDGSSCRIASKPGLCAAGICYEAPTTTTGPPTTTIRTTTRNLTMTPNATAAPATTTAGYWLNDVPPLGHSYLDFSLLISGVSTEAFLSSSNIGQAISRAILNQTRALGFTQVDQVIIIRIFASTMRRDIGTAMDVRIDSAALAEYIASLQQMMLKTSQFGDAITVYLRQYNLTLFSTSSVSVLRVYSLRENAPPTSAPSTASDDTPTKLAIGLPIGLICLIIIVIILVIRCRKTRVTDSSATKNYDQALLALELGSLSAQRRRAQTFSSDLDVNPQDNFVQAMLPENQHKNRYTDVLPYDSTRAKLFPVPGVPGSDYINASFIQGYGEDTWNIATQGPLQNTCNDFWRMVWEQRVSVIAMLSKLKESGREKVYQYWPDEIGVSRQYDEVQIKLLAAADERDYVLRTFKLTHSPTNKTIEIRHLQYLAWPDHGVPLDSSSFLSFAQEVRRAHHTSTPLIVHCSAGVGRAGTFLAANHQMHKYDQEGTIDIPEVVARMRRERPLIVQTASQYVFLHQVLVDYIVNRPAQSAPRLDANTVRFLHQFRTAGQAFDIGRNGRRVFHIGELLLVDPTTSKWKSKRQKVELVLFSDVLIVCAVKGEGETIRELMYVLDRDSLTVDASIAADSDKNAYRLTLHSNGRTFLFETHNSAERSMWVQILQDRATFIKTLTLRGPRLVPLARLKRDEVVRWLDISDPFSQDGQSDLEREWRLIPKIFNKPLPGIHKGSMVSNPLFGHNELNTMLAWNPVAYEGPDETQIMRRRSIQSLAFAVQQAVEAPESPSILMATLPTITMLHQSSEPEQTQEPETTFTPNTLVNSTTLDSATSTQPTNATSVANNTDTDGADVTATIAGPTRPAFMRRPSQSLREDILMLKRRRSVHSQSESSEPGENVNKEQTGSLPQFHHAWQNATSSDETNTNNNNNSSSNNNNSTSSRPASLIQMTPSTPTSAQSNIWDTVTDFMNTEDVYSPQISGLEYDQEVQDQHESTSNRRSWAMFASERMVRDAIVETSFSASPSASTAQTTSAVNAPTAQSKRDSWNKSKSDDTPVPHIASVLSPVVSAPSVVLPAPATVVESTPTVGSAVVATNLLPLQSQPSQVSAPLNVGSMAASSAPTDAIAAQKATPSTPTRGSSTTNSTRANFSIVNAKPPLSREPSLTWMDGPETPPVNETRERPPPRKIFHLSEPTNSPVVKRAGTRKPLARQVSITVVTANRSESITSLPSPAPGASTECTYLGNCTCPNCV